MPWSDVIGQERVKQVLGQSVEQNRVAHAYLFHGPDGVGKCSFALEFARLLQCETGVDEACGTCSACDRIRRGIHPDVHLYLPRPSKIEAEDSEYVERVRRTSENPYHDYGYTRRPSLDFTGSAKRTSMLIMYSVGMVNKELKRMVSLSPFEGRYKIAILLDAEHLNVSRQEGGNAFLKVLEEPSPRTVFILVSERPDLLLPTIRSRCQPVRFHPLEPETLEVAIRNTTEAGHDIAAAVARMADGSFKAAYRLIHDEVSIGLREEVLSFLRKCWAKDEMWLTDFAERLSRHGREHTTTFLRFLLAWIRDIILVRELRDDAPIVNVDQKEAISKFSGSLRQADLGRMVELVEDAIRLVPRMVQPRLIALSLADELFRAMRGEAGDNGLLLLADQLVRDQTVNLSA